MEVVVPTLSGAPGLRLLSPWQHGGSLSPRAEVSFVMGRWVFHPPSSDFQLKLPPSTVWLLFRTGNILFSVTLYHSELEPSFSLTRAVTDGNLYSLSSPDLSILTGNLLFL